MFFYTAANFLAKLTKNNLIMTKLIMHLNWLTRNECCARSWHSLWGNGRKRPKESTKTRTKLMLEGIGDEYRLLAGSDAVCKGRCVPMQKGRIGCTNRQCQKLWKARSELVWCQNAIERSTLWPSVNSHRRTFSRPSSSIRPKARIGNADLVRLPFEEIRRCRQTSSFVTKRLFSKSCRQSLRALLVWPVPGKGAIPISRPRRKLPGWSCQ